MMHRLTGIFLLFLDFSTSLWTIQVEQGKLRESGQDYRSISGRPLASFLGIPYGKSERFQRPQKAEKWEGVFVADRHIQCAQPDCYGFFPGFSGVEDCLVLNVYVPRYREELLPVLFWVHGGGFVSGSGLPELYGPDYLLEEDVILVTVNYRLGALGFLGLGDDVLPGNLGLWDQNLALKWVRDNINAFGGDAQKVTLWGQSAGGICASFHLLSHQSRGLFSGIIIQSGIFTVPYSNQDKHPAYYARTLAQEVGCNPKGDSLSIRQCLNKLDARTIQESALDLFRTFLMLPNPFKPHLDNSTSDPFIHRDPWEAMEDGDFEQVPMIFGYNEKDGLMFSAQYLADESLFQRTRDHWERILPLMMFQREIDELTPLDVTVASTYVVSHSLPDSAEDLHKLTDLFTLFYQNTGAIGVETFSRLNDPEPVFSYTYSHRGHITLADFIAFPLSRIVIKKLASFVGLELFSLHSLGPCHSDELFLQFLAHSIPFDPRANKEDAEMSRKLVQWWVNFAKYRDPTPGTIEWPKLQRQVDGKLFQANLTGGLVILEDATPMEEGVRQWKELTKGIPRKLHKYDSPTWRTGGQTLYRPKRIKIEL